MSYSLSICIPTFNRYKYLKEIFDNTLIFMLKHDIEVCISNNASNDETDSYLIDLVTRYPKIKYKSQKSNVGIDQNMIDVINMSTNEYVLAMGDDDMLITKNFLGEISILDKKPDLLILNGLQNQNQHLSKDLRGAIFTDKNIAFNNLWGKMPFGSFIFKKELFNEMYYQKYIGTSHAYTGVIWDAISLKHNIDGSLKVFCGKMPLINYMDVPKTWRNDAFKIVYYEIPLWFKLLQSNYPVIESKAILIEYLKTHSNFSYLLYYRSKDKYYKENISKYMECFSKDQVMKAHIIRLVPSVVAEVIIVCVNSIKKVIKWKKH